MLQEDIVLVDHEDREIGIAEKLETHRRGDLHRAFSVLIWDSAGRLLLQRRQIDKYHSGGLWTNSCCGHPRPGERSGDAALRRLGEEMGIACPLTPIGTFTYRAELGDLIEHELVHLFQGTYDGAVAPNPKECDGFSWSTPAAIQRQIASVPEAFTAWFRKYVEAGWPISPPIEIALSQAGVCAGRSRSFPFVLPIAAYEPRTENRRNVMQADEITIIILAIANAALCFVIFHLASATF